MCISIAPQTAGCQQDFMQKIMLSFRKEIILA